jgi:glutamate/tyrosine decarboxylase-like PLP-dependent enzyme
MSALPKTAFIDPTGQNQAEITALLQDVLALLVEEMGQAEQRSPLPAPLANSQFEQWATIPEQSVDAHKLIEQVRSQLRHSMNAAHPGYMGHMDSIPTTLSVVGDLLVAALNNNMLSLEMSPVFSRLEPLVMQQLATKFGLGAQSGGVMVSGGSLANLQALSVARNVHFDAVNRGIVGLARQPVFFVSEVAHTSMQKAAMVMGLGADAAIALRTNSNSQVDITDLKDKIAAAQQAQQQPFAIVATAGTTVTGNIDPLVEMGAIAQSHNLWFHVDAAYGGGLVFSPEQRDRLAGVHQADSVTFNPQKWLYVSKTCATVLFKNFDLLKQHFRILAPYMGDDSEWANLGELNVQGTRHPDILKLWLSLQHIGSAGYAEIIRHNYALTNQFVQAVQARPALQLASEPQMNLICFRLAPHTSTASALKDHSLTEKQQGDNNLDTLNAALQSYLLATANTTDSVFLSLPRYKGQRWLKAVLLNPYTSPQHIQKLFNHIDAFIQKHLS